MDNKFSLAYQYQLYLERCCLKESEMGSLQKVETKRAFMGACGQILVLLRDDISELPTDEMAVDVLDNMFDQVGKYFMVEVLNNQLSKN